MPYKHWVLCSPLQTNALCYNETGLNLGGINTHGKNRKNRQKPCKNCD